MKFNKRILKSIVVAWFLASGLTAFFPVGEAANVATSASIQVNPENPRIGQTLQITFSIQPAPPPGYSYQGSISITARDLLTGSVLWSFEPLFTSNASGSRTLPVELLGSSPFRLKIELTFYGATLGSDYYEPSYSSIEVDVQENTPPTTGSVVIDGGAATTNSLSVTLTLYAEDDSSVVEMRINNYGWFANGWESYLESKSWTLTSGDGTKTVYVQFKDDDGAESDVYSDTIDLDTTPPTMGSVVIDGGAATTNSLSVTLTLYAEDAESGVGWMCFSNDGSSWSNWEGYSTSKGWTLTSGDGTKTVYVQFRDNAENPSITYSDTIDLETGKTDSSISISASATTLTVGESTTVSGSLSPPQKGASVKIHCRPSGGTWTTLETVATDSNGGYSYAWAPTTAGSYEIKASWEGDENTFSCENVKQPITVKLSPEDGLPLWVLAPIIGGVTGVTAVLVYFVRRKHKEEVLKPPEPIIAVEPTEISPPPSAPPKVKGLPKLSAKCHDTIALLNGFIEDPSRTNDRKAWRGFREFVGIAEQIEDEYAELIEIRNKLAVLRRKRDEYRSAGFDDLAYKTEGVIQRNYGESIRIIKEIQEKLPQLGK